jgi:hypothetical protein
MILLQVPMADQFRADGKIYVVLGVILILMIGFFVFLFRTDRRVRRLEEKEGKKK